MLILRYHTRVKQGLRLPVVFAFSVPECSQRHDSHRDVQSGLPPRRGL